MTITKKQIRFCIHFAFYLKKNVAEATKMICIAYGENAVSHAMCVTAEDITRHATEPRTRNASREPNTRPQAVGVERHGLLHFDTHDRVGVLSRV